MSVIQLLLCIIVIAIVIGIEYWLHSDTRIIRDTSTSISDVGRLTPEFNAARYRRKWLGLVVACTMAVLIIHLRFPNTHWRDQVWLGLQLGIVPGWIAGVMWHLFSIKSPFKISLKNILIYALLFSCLVGIAVFHSIPNLLKQEERVRFIHSLGKGDISQVNFVIEPANRITITTLNNIDVFKSFLDEAKISNRKKDANIKNMRVEIKTDRGSFVCEAFIPSDNQNDVLLEFPGNKSTRFILLPDLKRWLDENILNQEESIR